MRQHRITRVVLRHCGGIHHSRYTSSFSSSFFISAPPSHVGSSALTSPSRSFSGGSGGVAASTSTSTSTICPRSENFSKWYSDLIAAAALVDASPVKGCAILRPAGYSIWSSIQSELDRRIKENTNASNVYFPLLVPTSLLSKEADHIEGFAKECAVVTHHRLRSVPATANGSHSGGGVEVDPSSKLSEPLVIRPTSEAVIWDAFSRWITSHRDLPMNINQWANVVRWEMRTRPFLRTSEFLWQEGHTAHATAEEARALAQTMQKVYSDFLREVLAVPCIAGAKSPSERFAGADDTLTCEAIMQNGWALQSATSHYLGTHFSKAFKVAYTGVDGKKELVYGTSWGASTRLIGALILSHSDDSGLVLPPSVAQTQVVVVAIGGKGGKDKVEVVAAAAKLAAELKSAGLRVALDVDVDTHPGSRYFLWERKGVPLRIEIGARDIKNGAAAARDRIGSLPRSTTISLSDSTATTVKQVRALLDGVQKTLLERAEARQKDLVVETSKYDDLRALAEAMGGGKGGKSGSEGEGEEEEEGEVPVAVHKGKAPAAAGTQSRGSPASTYSPTSRAFLVPWCDDAVAEAAIKSSTRFTLRCFPADKQQEVKGKTCFYSGKPATHMALFARAY